MKSTSLKYALTMLLAAFAADASALDKPTGDVILTVKGAITSPNAGDVAQFDLAMLDALAGRKASMETPWTTGTVEFSGPLLRAVLEAAGAEGRRLSVRALNDYAADVPMEDAQSLDTILATRIDGQLMSVRQKGPLMLVYPFDLDSQLYNEKYFSRSVWQIREIEVAQ